MSVTSIFKSFPVSRQTHAELKREIRRSDADAFRDVWVKLLGKPRRRFLKRMASEPLLASWSAEFADLSGREQELATSVDNLIHSVSRPPRKSRRIGRHRLRCVGRDSFAGRISFAEVLANWQVEATGPLGAWETLAVSEMVLRETDTLPPETLIRVLSLLHRDALDVGGEDVLNSMEGWIGESVHSVLGIEAVFARGLVLRPLGTARQGPKSAAAALNRLLLACCDADGLPHGSLLRDTTNLIASLTRASLWGAAFHQPLWDPSGEERLAEVSARAAAMLLPSGELAHRDTKCPRNSEQASELTELPLAPRILRHALRLAGAKPQAKLRRLVSDCSEPDQDRASVRKRAVRQSADGRSKATGKTLCSWQSDRSCMALMRSSMNVSADVMSMEWHSNEVTLSVAAMGLPLLSGHWTREIKVDGEPVKGTAVWSCSCWFLDREASFAELETKLAGGVTLVRHLLLLPQDHLLFMTDTVSCEAAAADVKYSSTIPLQQGVTCEPDEITRALSLRTPNDADFLARVSPVWTADDRIVHDPGSLKCVNDELVLSAVGRGGISVPLILDWHPRRRMTAADWTRLTVAESRRIVGGAEAGGFRLRSGKHQWLVYRSLKQSRSSRTVLGLHTADESVYARISSGGQIEPLVHVEPFSD